MEDQKPSLFKRLGTRDWIFIGFILVVVAALTFGSSERKTAPTPNDATHQNATSHEQCMACHGADGARPQPIGHPGNTQCFMCHLQPEGWKGKSR